MASAKPKRSLVETELPISKLLTTNDGADSVNQISPKMLLAIRNKPYENQFYKFASTFDDDVSDKESSASPMIKLNILTTDCGRPGGPKEAVPLHKFIPTNVNVREEISRKSPKLNEEEMDNDSVEIDTDDVDEYGD